MRAVKASSITALCILGVPLWGEARAGRPGDRGARVWRAGGGIRGGQVYGAPDDLGWGVVEKPVHINDFHATILHLFGMDHLKLTHRFQGRDFRLTDVAGEVVSDWIS